MLGTDMCFGTKALIGKSEFKRQRQARKKGKAVRDEAGAELES